MWQPCKSNNVQGSCDNYTLNSGGCSWEIHNMLQSKQCKTHSGIVVLEFHISRPDRPSWFSQQPFKPGSFLIYVGHVLLAQPSVYVHSQGLRTTRRKVLLSFPSELQRLPPTLCMVHSASSILPSAPCTAFSSHGQTLWLPTPSQDRCSVTSECAWVCTHLSLLLAKQTLSCVQGHQDHTSHCKNTSLTSTVCT